MVKRYENPFLEIVLWEHISVITSSDEYELPIAPGNDGTELPIIPADVF